VTGEALLHQSRDKRINNQHNDIYCLKTCLFSLTVYVTGMLLNPPSSPLCTGFVIAVRPQTPKHIREGWSHYTDTSEPVDGMGLKIWSLSNPDSNQRPFDHLPTSLPTALNGPVAQSVRGSDCGSEGMGFDPHSGQSKVSLFSLSIFTDRIVLVVQSCRVPTPPSTGSLMSV
jgi:hypothetical protein